MSLADEMRYVSEAAVNADEELTKLYTKIIFDINEVAKKGKREMVFPYIASNNRMTTSEYIDTKEKLTRKLRNDGFRVCRGSEIGKGQGNWNTLYIVW